MLTTASNTSAVPEMVTGLVRVSPMKGLSTTIGGSWSSRLARV